jgi:flagellar motility protein MotE (MotC chaperone)
MSAAPRLLPVIAVAIGGVLAVKALSGAQALPDLIGAARAQAEEAPRSAHQAGKPATAAPTAPPLPPTPKPGSAMASAALRPSLPCIQSPTDLAREAGVSPGELQVLQNLGARRGQLDDREKALDTQLQLLAAAEAKVDAKLKAVSDVKAQIQALVGQAGQQQQADIDRLTIVYQKMKPRDAAAVMATLDEGVRLQVAAKMKDAALAAILGQMPTVEAKKLTESLAHRADTARQALAQAEQPPAVKPDAAAQSTDPLAAPAPAKPAARTRHAHPRKLAARGAPTPTEAAVAALAPPPKPAAATPAAASARAAPQPASKPASALPAKG